MIGSNPGYLLINLFHFNDAHPLRFSDLPPALQVAVAYNKVREISTRRHRSLLCSIGSVHRIVQSSDYLMVAHFAVLEVIEWGDRLVLLALHVKCTASSTRLVFRSRHL